MGLALYDRNELYRWLAGHSLEHLFYALEREEVDLEALPLLSEDDFVSIGLDKREASRLLVATEFSAKMNFSEVPRPHAHPMIPPSTSGKTFLDYCAQYCAKIDHNFN